MVGEWFLSLKISKIGSFITKSVFPGEGGFPVRLHNFEKLVAILIKVGPMKKSAQHLLVTAKFPSFRTAYSFSSWILLHLDHNTVCNGALWETS